MELINLQVTPGNYAEVGQYFNVQFCLVDGNHKPLHETSKCREFLNDYLEFQYRDSNKQDRYNIYRFTVDKQKDCPLEEVELFFVFSEEQKDRAKKNFEVISAIDHLMGVKDPCSYTEYKNGMVFTLPVKVKTAMYLISFYSMMLKTIGTTDMELSDGNSESIVSSALNSVLKGESSNEYHIVKQIQELIIPILINSSRVVHDNPSGLEDNSRPSTKHGQGIQALISCITQNHEFNVYANKHRKLLN